MFILMTTSPASQRNRRSRCIPGRPLPMAVDRMLKRTLQLPSSTVVLPINMCTPPPEIEHKSKTRGSITCSYSIIFT